MSTLLYSYTLLEKVQVCFESVDVEDSEGAGGASTVADEFVAFVAFDDDAAAVHVVFAMAGGAGGNACGGHLEGFAAHGDGIGVEAVGAFAVVSVEGEVVPRGVADNEAFVHAESDGAALVDGVEDGFGGLPLVAGELEVLCASLVLQGDGDEHAAIGGHGRGERGVLVHSVVEHQIAATRTVLVLGFATREDYPWDNQFDNYTI